MNTHSNINSNYITNLNNNIITKIKQNTAMKISRNITMNTQQWKKVLVFIGEKRVITSSELAKFLGVSWNTAEKYLLELALENKIIRIKKKGVNLWMLK